MKPYVLVSAFAFFVAATPSPLCVQHDDCARAVASYLASHDIDFCCRYLSDYYDLPGPLGRWSDTRIKAACRCLRPPTSTCTTKPTSTTTTTSTSTTPTPACKTTFANEGFEAGLAPWSVETNGFTPYAVQSSNTDFQAHSGSKYFLASCPPTGNACFTAVCQEICLESGRTYDFSAYAAQRCNAPSTGSCGSGYLASANFYISPVDGSSMVPLAQSYTRINYSLAYKDVPITANACVYLTVEGVTANEGLAALDDVRVDRK